MLQALPSLVDAALLNSSCFRLRCGPGYSTRGHGALRGHAGEALARMGQDYLCLCVGCSRTKHQAENSVHHHRGTPPLSLSVCNPTLRSQRKTVMVYATSLGRRGKWVYIIDTIGPERKVQPRGIRPRKKAKKGGFYCGAVHCLLQASRSQRLHVSIFGSLNNHHTNNNLIGGHLEITLK